MTESTAIRSEDLWRPSIFTLDGEPGEGLFHGLRLDALSSLTPKETTDDLFSGLSDDFGLPPLEDTPHAPGIEDLGLEQDLPANAADDHLEQPKDLDVWSLDQEPTPLIENRLHTWEAFESKDAQHKHPFYLTEAGDEAFDAIFQQREQAAGVIRHDPILRACCSLVLGRSSTLFRWDPAKRSFVETLDGVSISGFSLAGTKSMLRYFMTAGTSFRQISDFVTRTSPRDCTAMVALKRSVTAVLDHVERYICAHISHVSSLLQLQGLLERPLAVMTHLDSIMHSVRNLRTDERLISVLSDQVTLLAQSGSSLSASMHQILAHVSMPWLQRLAEDTGLSSSLCTRQDHPDEKPSHGINVSANNITLVSEEDHRMISSVKQSVRLLRQHVPDHPVSSPNAAMFALDNLQASPVPQTDFAAQRAEEYRNRMLQVANRGHQTIASPVAHSHLQESRVDQDPSLDGDPFLFTAFDEKLMKGGEMTSDPSTEDRVFQGLHRSLDMALEADADIDSDDLAQAEVDVLAPLRPFIETQASLVSDAVLDYLFTQYKLRDHLELHRAYHLFGNGDFVTHLTTALFSDEVQSAERKRGNIPTSETMGLRLGSRQSQRWPPASSELRLTLLNVLTESFAPGSLLSDTEQLPGGLSFAIRELTDAEIDRVMDPASIYALDFLRLQYTPPSPLSDIFSPTTAQHYDSIFRTLLVHVRVLHATSQLCTKRSTTHDGQSRFAWKTRHFATALFSHFTDTVVAEAWSKLSNTLDAMQPEAADQARQPRLSTKADISSISRSHESCLDEIRSKLFLRRKHEKVRSTLEELADIILKTTAVAVHGVQGDVPMAERESRFDALSDELCTMLVNLAAKVDRDTGKGAHEVQSESEAAKLLLSRLSWRAAGG